MSHSFAQFSFVPCQKCRKNFPTMGLYVIVDVAERPDLLEKIHSGTLHIFTCPHCGREGQVNAPLLVFRKDADPHILFSPALRTSQEESQYHASSLIEKLKDSLGTSWEDDWLKDGLTIVPRQALSNLLSEDHTSETELPEQQVPKMGKMNVGDSGDYFLRMLDAMQETVEQPREQKRLTVGGVVKRYFLQILTAWTGAQDELDKILEELNEATQRNDFPRRIALGQQALDKITREAEPELWGRLQNNLAKSLIQNPTGDRAENIEQAIQLLQQSLEVRTPNAFPQDWAATQSKLVNAYTDRIRGNRTENIEQAIQHGLQALKVYTRQAFPQNWMVVQYNLANLYTARHQGERAENLEQAIRCFQQALELISRQDNSQDWAGLQNNLACAYADRIRGNPAENIEQAIRHYQQAMEEYTRQAFPQSWAGIQNNLATTYLERIQGEHADNIEQAIKHCQQALEVRTRTDFPKEWTQTVINLAVAYFTRIKGERAENIEQAIQLNHQALEVLTYQDFPQDWAGLQNNLANAYNVRILGEREDNIEQAIKYYQQALVVYTREAFPEQWARTQSNLGTAYDARIQGERAENFEQSISHYQQALEVATYQAFPQDWAMTQNNLATTYVHRIRGEHTENIEQAIEHFQQALKVRTQEAFLQDWAQTVSNLAVASAQRLQGERAENIDQAIQYYHQALEVYTYQAFPNQCCTIARDLGNLAFDQQRWELARDAYEKAFAANAVLMQTSFTRLGKRADLREMQTAPSRAAYAYFQLGESERAVEMLEQGRAQMLREALERQRRDLEQLPALGFKKLYQDYSQAIQEYGHLQARGKTESTHSADWMSKVEGVLEGIQFATAAIREQAGQDYPQYRYFMRALPFAEIKRQTAANPLVYLSVTSTGGLALVVTQQGAQSFDLPGLKQDSLLKHIWSSTEEEDERLSVHLDQGYISLQDIQAASGGYISMYRLLNVSPYLANTSQETKEKIFITWQETLVKTTRWLWDVVMGELIAILKKDSESLTLIPTGWLALLPLHAAWIEDLSKPTGCRYALDELTITYVPSAHALWQSRLSSERSADRLMVVDNPDGTLVFAADEVQAVLYGFENGKSKHLPGKKAKVEVVKKEMQKAQVLHFSTHGIAGWQEAEQARLKLADGDLTLTDIFELDLDQTRLAVLSACETGVPGLELIEEMIGLPAGMMQAGVPGVIGSLWAVNDMSTAMLMAQFYSLWREEKQSPQEALRQAQIWLRDSTTEQKKKLFKHFVEQQGGRMSMDTAQAFYQHIGWDDTDARVFASPYYWAAFTYTGV
ncbi:MAG: CHAT domain-containing protein [Chloroflexi bacterium]|nr:CHAT domain-containing protein [Chloroflexota bacterium]